MKINTDMHLAEVLYVGTIQICMFYMFPNNQIPDKLEWKKGNFLTKFYRMSKKLVFIIKSNTLYSTCYVSLHIQYSKTVFR